MQIKLFTVVVAIAVHDVHIALVTFLTVPGKNLRTINILAFEFLKG